MRRPATVPATVLAAAIVLAAIVLAACSGGTGLSGVGIERRPATTMTEKAPPVAAAPSVTDVVLDEAPVAADNPTDLAAQIVQAERAIRDPATPLARLARAAHLQQNAYRALVAHPEWDADVAAALPEDLRPVAAGNLAAGRELAQLVRRSQENLPAWRIVSPAPAEELRRYYEEAQAAFGVPWEYLAAIHLTETRMGRIRGLSSAGAQGPMQFLPRTWARYGEGDINDNRDAILGAARYLVANGAPADMGNALFRYNPTPRYVNAVNAYAEQIRANERAYLGYYFWQVYYVSTLGEVWLRVGYESDVRRPVTPADLG